MNFQADIGIIGGSGFYQLNPRLADKQLLFQEIETPYAKQKVKLTQESLSNRNVYFLPRHGEQHNLPPHKINYRANLWALKEAGVKKIIAVNAVGGIKENLPPGSIVIPDQLIDYTWGREHSFFDGLTSLQDHSDFTYPYDSQLRRILLDSATDLKMSVSDNGCFGCTQGPRLETAAEIQKFKRDGCDLVGMTGMPEAALARELGIAYVCIALVVNPAAGLSERLISMDDIKKVLNSGLNDIRSLISASLLKI